MPWINVIKDCSSGGATYIIGELIADIANLMQVFKKLSSPKLLKKLLRYCTLIVLRYVK